MSRDVTVHDCRPETLALLKKLSKQTNPRQAAREAFRVGVELLGKDTEKAPLPKAKAKAKPKAKAKAKLASPPVDLTADATPESI